MLVAAFDQPAGKAALSVLVLEPFADFVSVCQLVVVALAAVCCQAVCPDFALVAALQVDSELTMKLDCLALKIVR